MPSVRKRGNRHRRTHRETQKEARHETGLVLQKNDFGRYILSGMKAGSITIENDQKEELVNIQVVQLPEHGLNVIVLNPPAGQKIGKTRLRQNIMGEDVEVEFLKKT